MNETAAPLRPCPFCGSDQAAFTLGEAAGKWAAVECGACGAKGPDVRANYRNEPREPWHLAAAKAWNERVS